MRRNIHETCRLQFISHQTEKVSCLEGIRAALAGGCRWIQLRMKGATDDEVRPIARQAGEWCKSMGATFIIDDRVNLAREVEADGVHLGKDDMPVAQARRVLGDGFIIGGTANTFDDIKAHHLSGADYIGCGPFRFTTTKEKLSPILGLEGYRRIMSRMKEEGIAMPVVAIGGITPGDIPGIMQTGVTGIALSGSILNAADPIEETKKIKIAIDKWKN